MTAEGNEPKMCQKILGYDANVLYPWAIMQDMPTGAFARRRKINQGKTKSRKRNQQLNSCKRQKLLPSTSKIRDIISLKCLNVSGTD